MIRSLTLMAMLPLTSMPAQSKPEPAAAPATLAIGMIGLDTSHVVAFTKVFNDPAAKGHLATMRVVAGYPGGSAIPTSRDRVKGYTAQLAKMGVAIVDSIPELLRRVDVVMLESVDGNPHLEQARPVILAGKPLFIDKPLAASLRDVLAIDALARKHRVPWFSSSSLRFGPALPDGIGNVTGCDAWSPCVLEPSHPDLFWYGIHGVESLFTVLGPGCVSVTRSKTAGTDLVTGVWRDGRIGTFRGLRVGKRGYGAMVFGTRGFARLGDYQGYKPLVVEIAGFFRTGKVPVDPAVTIEIYAFMAAAQQSSATGGRPVTLASVLAAARAPKAPRK